MANVANRLKIAMLKGMEAVGKSASNLASNAQLKVSEINLESRRREILSEFPLRAHELWLKGVELPEPLGDMMAEMNELDERLSVLRAQRYAKVAEGGEEAVATDGEAETDGEAATGEANEAAALGEADGAAASETDGASEPAESAEEAAESPEEAAEDAAPAAADAPDEGGNA